MSRTLVRRRGAVLVTVLVVFAVVGNAWTRGLSHHASALDAPKAPSIEAPWRRVVVAPGDSLWSIATRLSGPREDPRPLVDAIAALNHVRHGHVVPGQSLLVP